MSTPTSSANELIGCCVIGPKHEDSGVPCQDACHYHQLSNNHVVIAVGDGVGSARLSHVGANIATEVVADALKDAYGIDESIDPIWARWMFYLAFQRARRALVDEAAERGIELPALDTTLHAVVAGPSGIAGAGVGDGGAVYRDSGTYETLYPRELEIAEVDAPHKTHPLTLTNWEPFYRFDYSETGDRVAVFSDGLEAWTWDGSEVNAGFFESAFDLIKSADYPGAAVEQLHDALTNENFRRSRDDKTFLLARWGSQAKPEASASAAVQEPDTIVDTDSPVELAGAQTSVTSAGGVTSGAAADSSTIAPSGTSPDNTAPVPTVDGAAPIPASDKTTDDDSAEATVVSERSGRKQIPVVDVGIQEEEIVLKLNPPGLGEVEIGLSGPRFLPWSKRLKRLLDATGAESIEEIIGKSVPCRVTVKGNHARIQLDWRIMKDVSDYPAVRVLNTGLEGENEAERE